MSGYLARLVQRASGRGLTASASPVAHAPQPVGDSRDPFEVTAPLAPATPPPVSAVPRDFTESPVRAKSPDVPPDRVPYIESRPASDFEPPPLSPEPRTIPPPQVSASPESFRDSPITPAPRVEARRTERLAPNVETSLAKPERLTPAHPPILNSPAPLTPRAPVRIEPVRKERPAPPPPIAQPTDEPRLVIGQMKVEIIPAAPTPPPRASSRSRPHIQPARSAASPRAQFGLGQM
jgi:hypothetical protein